MTREEAIKEWIIPALKNTWNEKKNAEILKALEQEPCDDAISRQAVLEELPRRTMRNYFGEVVGDVVYIDDIKALPPVTPQPKNIHIANIHFDEEKFKEKFKEICKNAPLTILDDSNTPTIQPKMGRWIADVDRWGDIITTVNGYRCSECNAFNTDKDNYCPNCGAKMQEVEE